MENLLRVYFTRRRTYSGYTIQQGEPTQGILYNMENLSQGILYKHGEPTQGILYNKENLLCMGILYNKENVLRVYFTTRRTCSGYSFQLEEPKALILSTLNLVKTV